MSWLVFGLVSTAMTSGYAGYVVWTTRRSQWVETRPAMLEEPYDYQARADLRAWDLEFFGEDTVKRFAAGSDLASAWTADADYEAEINFAWRARIGGNPAAVVPPPGYLERFEASMALTRAANQWGHSLGLASQYNASQQSNAHNTGHARQSAMGLTNHPQMAMLDHNFSGAQG